MEKIERGSKLPTESTRINPTSNALRILAEMPEDLQKMALGFAYGIKAVESQTAIRPGA